MKPPEAVLPILRKVQKSETLPIALIANASLKDGSVILLNSLSCRP
jgi:hypothetical protein